MKSIVLIIIVITISSCKKLLDVEVPKTKVASELIFKSDAALTSAAVNLYNHLNFETPVLPQTGLYVDELSVGSSSADRERFFNNAITADETTVAALWQKLYFCIYQANLILDGLPDGTSISAELKNRVEGEAKFCRAMGYFYLVNFWGNVPLLLSPDVRENSSPVKTSAEKIYGQIIADLKDAKSLLLENYGAEEKTRVTKWAAMALLARTYLYTKDWANAGAEANLIIESQKFGPLPNLNDVFIKNSREAIFQFWTQNGFTGFGSFFIPSATSIPSYKISNHLMTMFELTDGRKASWIKAHVVAGVTHYYPYKYKNNAANLGVTGEYSTILRVSEQYLIRAEARAHLNLPDKAIDDLNVLRVRAGGIAPLSYIASVAAVLLKIYEERERELFTEAGHRFFDLKRTERINQELLISKPNWKPENALFPISRQEILRNQNLIQNPGYN